MPGVPTLSDAVKFRCAIVAMLLITIFARDAAAETQETPYAAKERLYSPGMGGPENQINDVPLIERARATYPRARKRFLAGLPKGHALFVTFAVRGHWDWLEWAYIRVQRIENERIYGTIANDLVELQDWHRGDEIEFSEDDILDWTIVKRDGTEEGNLLGKCFARHKHR